MFNRINLSRIVKEHVATLRDITKNDKKITKSDLLLFYIFPFLAALGLTFLKETFYNNIPILIDTMAILSGFLFNLLAVIYSQLDNMKNNANSYDENSEEGKIKRILVKEIHINISYSIVVAITSLIFLITYNLVKLDLQSYISCIFNKSFLTINYFLLIHFFLTLFMIINRIYILMKK